MSDLSGGQGVREPSSSPSSPSLVCSFSGVGCAFTCPLPSELTAHIEGHLHAHLSLTLHALLDTRRQLDELRTKVELTQSSAPMIIGSLQPSNNNLTLSVTLSDQGSPAPSPIPPSPLHSSQGSPSPPMDLNHHSNSSPMNTNGNGISPSSLVVARTGVKAAPLSERRSSTSARVLAPLPAPSTPMRFDSSALISAVPALSEQGVHLLQWPVLSAENLVLAERPGAELRAYLSLVRAELSAEEVASLRLLLDHYALLSVADLRRFPPRAAGALRRSSVASSPLRLLTGDLVRMSFSVSFNSHKSNRSTILTYPITLTFLTLTYAS